MTILAGIYGDPTFLDPIRVLSVRSHLIQALLIRSDPVRVLSIRSDPIRSGPIEVWLTPQDFKSIIFHSFCFALLFYNTRTQNLYHTNNTLRCKPDIAIASASILKFSTRKQSLFVFVVSQLSCVTALPVLSEMAATNTRRCRPKVAITNASILHER